LLARRGDGYSLFMEAHSLEEIMEITVEKIIESKKQILSEMLKAMKNLEDGQEYHHLDDYWTNADYIPYFILADGEIAGFVLLNKYFWVLPREKRCC
jgi:hypothetical protein